MQFELIQILCTCQSHHTCIVRTWRQFREIHSILMAQEKFNSPKAGPRQSTRHLLRHFLCFLQMGRINVCRLEALTIISPFLYMTDGRTEQRRSIFLRHRKQSYLAIKLNKFFNNQFLYITTTPVATIFPGMFQFVSTLHQRLTFAGRRHQRLHHTRKTNLFCGSFQFIQRFGIEVFGCFQS